MNGDFNKNKIALIVGGILVFLGLWQLAQRLFGELFAGFWKVFGVVVGLLGPLVIIVLGILLVVGAQKDKLSLPKNKKLFRSTKNKKIAGVCGGVAEYLTLDYATVRIIALVLAVVSFYLVLPVYVLLWVIIPPDSQKYDTWI
ncbi:MAG: PspC domain-containing protein [Coriobacteriales bacterium]|nr:PspC domain-containing protein [Coriobacteriales bacterium]